MRYATGNRGRGGVPGGGRDGDWTWQAAGGRGRGSSRGRGVPSHHYGGHDNRTVVKHDFIKQKSGNAWRTKGKGKGKGKGKKEESVPILVHSHAVDRVEEDGLARHCEVRRAHDGCIHAITITDQGVYTASQDHALKRWKPIRRGDGRYELHAELTVPLPDACYSLLFSNGWLFCGLWDGTIRAFSQDSKEDTLAGHSRRVTSLIVHQKVLISGGADRQVRLWQADPVTQKFKCTHTIEESIPGNVSKLHVLKEHLFVGGMSGVAMVDLIKLEVTKLLPPTKAVADFLEFEGHLIVAYMDGGLRVFAPDGTCKSELKPLAAGPILSIAGLESGPRVLCGHTRGQVSTIVLPAFEFKTQFQAIKDTKVESLLCVGHDGLFLTGCQDGTLQLWQRLG